jgi:cell division protein ZapA
MSSPLPISISILDKEYKIACPPGEQAALLESAQYLDCKMREIRDKGSIIGCERIAVIAALNIAHELLHNSQLESNLSESLTPRLKSLETRVAEALQNARQLEI